MSSKNRPRRKNRNSKWTPQTKHQKTDEKENTGSVFSNLSAMDRKRLLSSETSDINEDPEILIDAVLGALTNHDIIDRFVSALIGIPDIKSKLLEHLAPTLKTEVSAIVQPLQNDIKRLTDDLKESELKRDDLEQYGRRHSLRIAGIPENDGENTDLLICDFLQQELEIEIHPSDIDRSHRLGKKNPESVNPRPIAVKFVNYRLKELIYSNKRYLRAGLYINESLTKERAKLFYKARQLKKNDLIADTWTRDGLIFVKNSDNTVVACIRETDLPISFNAKQPPTTTNRNEKPVNRPQQSPNRQNVNKSAESNPKPKKQNTKTDQTRDNGPSKLVQVDVHKSNNPPNDAIEVMEEDATVKQT